LQLFIHRGPHLLAPAVVSCIASGGFSTVVRTPQPISDCTEKLSKRLSTRPRISVTVPAGLAALAELLVQRSRRLSLKAALLLLSFGQGVERPTRPPVSNGRFPAVGPQLVGSLPAQGFQIVFAMRSRTEASTNAPSENIQLNPASITIIRSSIPHFNPRCFIFPFKTDTKNRDGL
jgi:hypothetical protein